MPHNRVSDDKFYQNLDHQLDKIIVSVCVILFLFGKSFLHMLRTAIRAKIGMREDGRLSILHNEPWALGKQLASPPNLEGPFRGRLHVEGGKVDT